MKAAIRVAVVDDDDAVRKALARFLTASSFDIKTYGSAREFMDMGTAPPPECLVLDLHMPEVNGLELQHQLRHTGIDIPTIIVTAHNEPGLRERCALAGAAMMLLKPLNGSALVEAINAVATRTTE